MHAHRYYIWEIRNVRLFPMIIRLDFVVGEGGGEDT